MNIEKIREGLTLILEALDEVPEPTPQVSLPFCDDIDPEELKARLAKAAEKYGAPTVRGLIIRCIGGFKPATKMTPEELSKVDEGLRSL